MKYIVISFFTLDTPYVAEAANLEASLKRFSVPYKIYPRPNLGNWTRNTQQKSTVLADALREFPDTAVVWLDADAELLRNPEWFEQAVKRDFDAAFYRLSSDWDRNELLSGTMFLHNTPVIRELMDAWSTLNQTINTWDQKTLQMLVDGDFKTKLRIEPLPVEYIKVDRMDRFQAGMGEPVVYHAQASRRLKRLV